jgi:ribose 5-phosphate isomerase A
LSEDARLKRPRCDRDKASVQDWRMAQDDPKKIAGESALAELPSEGTIGIGTGSTTRFFIEALGRAVQAGAKYVGVPTSESSRSLAHSLGIPLLGDEGPWVIDVTVDGADEVDRDLHLIKGGGGAQTREKIVNFASKRNVIIVDESKLSAQLGERWAVPVEVLAFAHAQTAMHLGRFGRIAMRMRERSPWMTDSGNFIYDVATGPIASPVELDASLRAVPGVVETGLFCGRADVVLVAGSGGVRRLVCDRV